MRAKETITNLTQNINRDKNQIELSWKVKNADQVAEIIVYKQKENEKPTLWGTLSGAQNFLEDKEVNIGNTYTYFLKALLKNQQPAKTEKIIVEY